MGNEIASRGSRPAAPRKPSAKGNGNGNRTPRASVAKLDHHRLFREIEHLRLYGREVLARTRQMMSLLERTLARAQGYVDQLNRQSKEIENDRISPMKSPKSSAEKAKNKGPSRSEARRPA